LQPDHYSMAKNPQNLLLAAGVIIAALACILFGVG
jgi:hypothetical protein